MFSCLGIPSYQLCRWWPSPLVCPVPQLGAPTLYPLLTAASVQGDDQPQTECCIDSYYSLTHIHFTTIPILLTYTISSRHKQQTRPCPSFLFQPVPINHPSSPPIIHLISTNKANAQQTWLVERKSTDTFNVLSCWIES